MEQNKQLTVLNFQEISTMGKVFAESGMFTDAKAAAQAIVKIQAGQEIGIPPFAAMSGIHIIQGKPAIGAGLMASCVKGSGKYDYKVISQTDKECSIDFYHGSEKIGNSTFTEADAKKAQTKNMDKFPKNMLFARAMSNGVKWFTPDVFSGPVYTPEELNEQRTEDVSHEVVDKQTGEVLKATPVAKEKLSADRLTKAIALIEAGKLEVVDQLKLFTVTNPQQKLIDAAQLKGEQLLSAINSLELAGTETELAELRGTLPAIILESASFIDAEGKRREFIISQKA